MKIIGIHHVTMAVQDIDAARAEIAALFDAVAGPIDAVAPFGVRSTVVALGDDALELVAPMDADNPVMRYIERRGEGFYTLALEVDDLDAAVAELAARGVRISPPVEASTGLRTAFITMAATHGLSIQLLEAVHEPDPDPYEEQPASNRPSPPDLAPILADPTAEQARPVSTDEQAGAVSGADNAPAPNAPVRPVLDLTPDEWSDVD